MNLMLAGAIMAVLGGLILLLAVEVIHRGARSYDFPMLGVGIWAGRVSLGLFVAGVILMILSWLLW